MDEFRYGKSSKFQKGKKIWWGRQLKQRTKVDADGRTPFANMAPRVSNQPPPLLSRIQKRKLGILFVLINCRELYSKEMIAKRINYQKARNRFG